jgi:hypothetical protein
MTCERLLTNSGRFSCTPSRRPGIPSGLGVSNITLADGWTMSQRLLPTRESTGVSPDLKVEPAEGERLDHHEDAGDESSCR